MTTQPLKSIETVYKNYRFRSRLEARWGVWFDTMSLEYRYEPEGFDLGGTWYLPDFFLPREQYWIEIKGQDPTEAERQKASLLSEASGQHVYILAGDVGTTEPGRDLSKGDTHVRSAREIAGDSKRGGTPALYRGYGFTGGEQMKGVHLWCQCHECGAIGMKPVKSSIAQVIAGYLPCACYKQFWESDIHQMAAYLDVTLQSDSRRLIAAYTAARSARFERGEHGSR